MKGLSLMTLALVAAGCATTTDAPPRVSAPSPLEDADAVRTEAPPEQPSVTVVATSPTSVRFRTDATDVVVPLPQPQRRTVSNRRVWVRHGMLVGAVLGVIAGAAEGTARDRRESEPGTSCDPFACGGNLLVDPLAFGAIGLRLGAAAGAVIGAFDR